MIQCSNCGNFVNDGDAVCNQCGSPINQTSYQHTQYQNQWQEPQRLHPSGIMGRNIPLTILLIMVTCGIYGFYWFYKIEEETAILSGRQPEGGKVILLSIITCGIYSYFWLYQVGERMIEIKGKNESSTYLFLSLLGLSSAAMILMQNEINDAVGFQG